MSPISVDIKKLKLTLKRITQIVFIYWNCILKTMEDGYQNTNHFYLPSTYILGSFQTCIVLLNKLSYPAIYIYNFDIVEMKH